MADQVCDFCGSPDVAWVFDASDFSTGVTDPASGRERHSSGGWDACDSCKRAWEKDGAIGLTRRSVQSQYDRGNFARENWPQVEQALSALHRTFEAHRIGDPVPVAEFDASCPHERYVFDESSAFRSPGWYCARCGAAHPGSLDPLDGQRRRSASKGSDGLSDG